MLCFEPGKYWNNKDVFQSVTLTYFFSKFPQLMTSHLPVTSPEAINSPVKRTRKMLFRVCLCHWLHYRRKSFLSRTLRILKVISPLCYCILTLAYTIFFSLLFSLCFTAYCSNFSDVTTKAPADDVTAVPNESTASRLKGVLDISCSYLSSRTSCFRPWLF